MITNPISTGGGGVHFEQHVGAAFLAYLLVRGIPPCLTDCQIEEVQFQSKYRGRETDDLLILARNANNQQRRLLVSVKRGFTVSQRNEECVDVITKAWTDFNAGTETFDINHDRIALITLRGSNTLLVDFGGLLDCARAARDYEDSSLRSISQKAKEHHNSIHSILCSHCDNDIDEERVWMFLRVLCHIPLDLNTESAHTEAHIKSMLALCAVGDSGVTAAAHTWASLLEIAAKGKPSATAYRYDDLPQDIRDRHQPATTPASVLVGRLTDHSTPVLQDIKTAIGSNGYHCFRTALEGQLIEKLHNSHVVIVSGAAGTGKSALAKSIINSLSDDTITFAFRAEEFAAPHVDQAFQMARIPEPTSRLREILAIHGRKLFLIESAERLIERNERKAFTDFLQLIQDEPSWQLIVTCRDYHLDLVREALFGRVGLEHDVVHVPVLNDNEFDEAIRHTPQIAVLAQHARMRTLLRNPFLLGLAVSIQWGNEESLPSTIAAFRTKVWKDVIRDDANGPPGMPQRRASAFMEIARRRAQALSTYAQCEGLDPEVLAGLGASTLVTFSPTTDALAAIAHDVLEDWAIIKWIEERFAIAQGEYASFIQEIGPHPAMRRAFRTWLGEYLEIDAAGAADFVRAVTESHKVSQQVQDDTLVAILLSPTASTFFQTHEADLLRNEAQLLHRVIHLVRVACKALPDWVDRHTTTGVLVANHAVWQPVMRLVRRHLNVFSEQDEEELIALLEDWCFGIKPTDPLPVGAEDIAAITYALLSRILERHDVDDKVVEQLYRIVARVPHADRAQFIDLITTATQNARKDRYSRILAKVILADYGEPTVCKEFPEQTMMLACAHWLGASVVDAEFASIDYGERGPDSAFNIHVSWGNEFFPASAYHGPFWQLLRFYPLKAATFIVDLVNHCVEYYATTDHSYSKGDERKRISLVLADRAVCEQWFSNRLWCIYRGSEIGSYLLQCALMALERFLLDLCRHEHPNVEEWLTSLVKRSNNVAITSVVASAAMAYPGASGHIGLALLSCLDLFEADHTRWIKGHPRSPRSGKFGKHYQEERIESNSLEHRKIHLEHLIIQLQNGSLRREVWDIIDQQKQLFSAKRTQTDEHRLRRLLLTRIDVREYEPADNQPNPSEVQLELKQIASDIKEMLDRDAPAQEENVDLLSLYILGHRAYDRETDLSSDALTWKDNLARIRRQVESDTDGVDYMGWYFRMMGGMYFSVVCIRDHWGEMTEDERIWCLDLILPVVELGDEENDSSDGFPMFQTMTDKAAPVYRILPLLLTKDLDSDLRVKIESAFKKVLKKESDEIVTALLEGVGEYLPHINTALFDRSVQAVYETVNVMREMRDGIQSRQRSWEKMRAEMRSKIATRVDAVMNGDDPKDPGSTIVFDLHTDWGKAGVRRLMAVYSQRPADPRSLQFWRMLAESIVSCWRDDQNRNYGDYEQRDYELEGACLDQIIDICLRLQPAEALAIVEPLCAATMDCPEDIARFMERLTYTMSMVSQNDSTVFWHLWQSFADTVVSADAQWLANINQNYSQPRQVVNKLFLNIGWNTGLKHWHHMEGHNWRIDKLFQVLPMSTALLRAYSGYLYNIGETSLPNAFELIANRLKSEENPSALVQGSARSNLAAVLLRYVYSDSRALKSKPLMRKAVLSLLDILVEAGSSTAYKMRDDFVTPLPQDFNSDRA